MLVEKPRRPNQLLNITPLIDVVFILLVFFMLAGAIERPDPIEVAPPASTSLDFSDADDPKDLIVVLDGDGRIFIDDEEILSDPELTAQISAILAWRPDLLIHLKADAETEAVRMIDAMEAMRLGGAEYVVLITVGGGGAAS